MSCDTLLQEMLLDMADAVSDIPITFNVNSGTDVFTGTMGSSARTDDTVDPGFIARYPANLFANIPQFATASVTLPTLGDKINIVGGSTFQVMETETDEAGAVIRFHLDTVNR